MERHLFGTDGVRGISNRHPMTVEMTVRLGKAIAAHFLRGRRRGGIGQRPRVVIGKDTRLSGYMFEHSLAAGLMSMGVDVQLVGPMPTPGIAFMTTGMRADAGIVISASHNPYQDNGIKIFGSDGFKLPDEEELAIEILVDSNETLTVEAPLVGRAKRIDDATGRYIVALKNTFPRDLTLDGLRVVLDCANGAAYKVAPTVLRELGAEVFPIGVEPNGLNINEECGSLHPHNVARRVHETRADVGIALDGDADRLILIDEKGERIDGDKILALCAIYLKSQGKLLHDTLVSTVMSNIGLDIALRRQGIHVVRAPVGDRYVVEQMRHHGYNLGGEQSGHLIFMDHTTTGDGTLAALQVLAIMCRKARPLSEIAQVMEPLPQVLINVEVRDKPPLETLETFQHQREQVEGELGEEGRVLVRYSGTEPKARVMVEGPDDQRVMHYANELADCLRREIGA